MNDDIIPVTIHTLAELRADIALTRDFAYFQTGSEGPVPDSTQRFMCQILKEENGPALGGRHAYSQLCQRAESARQALAALLNVSPDELAWTQNTSMANRLAAGSLPWKEGDRLAITGAEHISTRILARGVEQITGRKATVIPVGDGATYAPARFLEQLDRLLTPDHRLLIMSHVSCIDGRRLPVAEATRLAHTRGVKVLIDGAQAVGQFPVDMKEIDPEFYAGSVHKWLLGPAGIGYLYVAKRQWPEYHPNLTPSPYPEEELHGNGPPASAATLTQLGTETMSLRMGAGHVVKMLQHIGIRQVEQHVRTLTRRLRDGLREIKGLEILSPYDWELSSGITSVCVPGWETERVHALIDRIWDEYRVVVKFQPEIAGVRISVAAFNSEDEVDRLLEAFEKLVPAMS